MRNGIQLEIKAIEGEFAAGNNDRPPTPHPAGIEFSRREAKHVRRRSGCTRAHHFFVHNRIEDLDDMPPHFEAVWQVNSLLKGLSYGLGDRRFSVAAGTIQENRVAGIHRWSKLAEDVWG